MCFSKFSISQKIVLRLVICGLVYDCATSWAIMILCDKLKLYSWFRLALIRLIKVKTKRWQTTSDYNKRMISLSELPFHWMRPDHKKRNLVKLPKLIWLITFSVILLSSTHFKHIVHFFLLFVIRGNLKAF